MGGCEDRDCKKMKTSLGTVKLRQGDMILCDDSNARRFGPLPSVKPKSKSANRLTKQTHKVTVKEKNINMLSRPATAAFGAGASDAEPETPTSAISLEEASAAVFEAEKLKVDSMSVTELNNYNALDLLPIVRDNIRCISHKSDDTAVANESFTIVNRLKNHATMCLESKRGLKLSFSPRAFADRILAQSPLSKSVAGTGDATTKVGQQALTQVQPQLDPQISITASVISCVPGCQLTSTEKGKIECLMCQDLFHRTCLGMKQNSRAAWICPKGYEISETEM